MVYGYQGTEEDSGKRAFTNKLLNAVLAEAQVVCIGQPLLIAGDLNANPEVIPCLAKGIASGKFIDLALAYSTRSGCAPEVTCRFKLEDGAGSRRDFMVACPNALAASSACRATDRWFTPHFSILAEFSIQQWNVEVACPLAICPIWPAYWIDTPDRSSSSLSEAVQDAWEFYGGELLGVPLFLRLREAYRCASVDDFWDVWSAGAEEGLFRVYCRAGGPVAGGAQRYLGRGRLRIRRRRLGGRSVGGVGSSRLYRVSQGDDVDVTSAQYIVTSSLAPVILFRRRLKSVADVLKGIRQHGFSQGRLDALHRYWVAVCRQGPCGPVFSLEPWAG